MFREWAAVHQKRIKSEMKIRIGKRTKSRIRIKIKTGCPAAALPAAGEPS
jgi:hypothetical protein